MDQIAFRTDYRPKDRDFIATHSNWKISELTICRTPIDKKIKFVTNLLTLGKLNKSFDEIYHLFLRIKLLDPKSISIAGHIIQQSATICIEKHQTVIISPFKDEKDMQTLPINLSGKDINFIDFLKNAQASVSSNIYFTYDGFKNNCQNFIQILLRANGFLTPEANKFIYQDVIGTVTVPEFTQKLSRGVTDFAHKLDVLTYGRGLIKVQV